MSDGKASGAVEEQVTEQSLYTQLDEVLEKYRETSGALIPVLQSAQDLFGYLPEQALKRISLRMGKSYSEVAGVVGFYSFFSTAPRGRHLVRVCLGTACYVRGAKQVLEAIKDHLRIDVGETTGDRTFSLSVARCFGACGLAPAMMIDSEVHQRVKANKVKDILDQVRLQDVTAKKGD
ncbi:MAG TPA: NAD(P)H-dependent oxidoreductase subunit E [Planctomycetota bacterium]|nr:NAD(P)H-dependent oxidoreductase subunit E [Planctomycetota bacterium]HRR78680.1 NAD(P)H-dependent oxidoreductase subunit E [Planctomycetota bacterium]HRT93348.1 NAD(P)H-dependent oxidoreductase subunit E [Planctomycetota bacterium]